jgi:hypothetical protein
MPINNPTAGGGGGSGTITEVDTGFGLTGGPITQAGVVGLAGPGTIGTRFTYASSSPLTLAALPGGVYVQKIELVITEPFNGTGATLEIGTVGAPGSLLSSSQNIPSFSAGYGTTPAAYYTGATTVVATIVPGSGASAGAGFINVTAG